MTKQKDKALRTASNNLISKFDTQGSYTGVSLDEYELPVQDADDL